MAALKLTRLPDGSFTAVRLSIDGKLYQYNAPVHINDCKLLHYSIEGKIAKVVCADTNDPVYYYYHLALVE